MFEINKVYLWDCDVVSPVFVLEEDNEQRESVKDGFMMQKGNTAQQYIKGVITPKVGCRCECIHIDPLIFNVERIVSPLFEDDVKQQQYKMVRRLLADIACSESDLEVQTIASVAIPWSKHDKEVTEKELFDQLESYLKDNVGREYSGNPRGALSHENKLKSVLTVLFGTEIAYAMMKLNDTGKVRVESKNGLFHAYYGDEYLTDYLYGVKKVADSTIDVQQKFFNAASMM